MAARPGRGAEAPFLIAAGTVAAPAPAPAPAATRLGLASGHRWPELDGHRGLAVIGIVVFNVYQHCNVDHFLYRGTLAYTVLNSLDAMVPWLFVLSAFLLFGPIAWAAINDPRSLSARGFLTRRAIRLLPLYYLAVTVVWFTRQTTLPGDWRDLLEHLTFTQVFDEKRIFYTIGPAWAISVEVFFCLFLAVLIVGLKRVCARVTDRRTRIAILIAPVALLAAVSLAWNGWSFFGAHHATTAAFTTWFGPLSNFAEFAVGMTLALALAVRGDRRPISSRSRSLLRLAAAGILVAAFATREAGTWTGVYFPTICAVGFGCLVAAAVLGPAGRWSRALSRAPLTWLGVISYSVYVWHEPIMLALSHPHGLVQQSYSAFGVDVIVVVALSLVAGWLSYRLIQHPTRQLDAFFTRDGHAIDRARRERADSLIRLRDPGSADLDRP